MPRFLRRWIRKSYFAGPETSDAVDACRQFAKRNIVASAGYWPGSEDTPQSVASAYFEILDAIVENQLDCSVSLKAMELDFDRQLVIDITAKAAEAAIGIHYDSRALELADQTFAMVAESAQYDLPVGCTLPGRWKRSLKDADFAIDRGANVRVVKGQWPDTHNPDINLRDGYMSVVKRLAGRARHVSIATHDPLLAKQALRHLIAAGTPCELEQLFGLPTRRTLRVARVLGVPVRMYIPYGNSWVPYVNAWIRKNPRVLWWITRDLLLGRHSYLLK